MTIAILNGPNLNKLGRRTPTLYGQQSMETILIDIQRQYPDTHFLYSQSNHEGDLIDRLQDWAELPVDGIIINAGGYSHTSIALRDGIIFVRESNIPIVEVHITNIRMREEFRRVSLLTDVCSHAIIGQGTAGYCKAVDWIMDYKKNEK